MKKIKAVISFILSITILCCVPVFAYATDDDETPFLLGDVDFDSQVTVRDALKALRMSAYIEKPTPEAVIRADTDGDSEITPPDARKILRVASRLDTFDKDDVPAVVSKMMSRPFAVDETLGNEILKDSVICSQNAVSVKTYEKEASFHTGGEPILRRFVVVNGTPDSDGEYDADYVHSQYIAYPDSAENESFGDYALYLGLLGRDFGYTVRCEDESVYVLYSGEDAGYRFNFDNGRLISIVSVSGESKIGFFVSDIRFDDNLSAEVPSSFEDITDGYFAEYTISSVLDSIDIRYATGDSAVYVTHDVGLQSVIDGYESASIKWESDSPAVQPDGTVTRDENNVVTARLTATVTLGESVRKKEFVLDIMPSSDIIITKNTDNDIASMNSDSSVIKRDSNGRVTLIDGVCSDINVDNFADALNVLYQNSDVLGADSDDIVFVPLTSDSGDDSAQYTFKEFYKGSEVSRRRVTLSVNSDGICDYIASGLCEESVLSNCPDSEISEYTACRIVENTYSNVVTYDTATLAIYALGEYEYAPAPIYIVPFFAADEDGVFTGETYVNAETGEIVKDVKTLKCEFEGTGKDENGVLRSFNTFRDKYYTYYMTDESRNITVYSYFSLSSGERMMNEIISFDNTFDDPTAVSAYLNVCDAYDWFGEKFSRNSYDNRGAKVKIAVHYTDSFDNAYWDSDARMMIFCENSDESEDLTHASSLDVAAHEYSHAVMNSLTGGIPYENATGAIDEAYADIFACLIGGDWTIENGDEIIRDIKNPYYLRNPIALGGRYYIDYRFDDDDYGGVHTNSTVVSHCAYVMSEYITDTDLLSRLWYRSLSLGYDGMSDFSSVRRNVIKAAEIMNLSAEEINVINKAFDDAKIY